MTQHFGAPRDHFALFGLSAAFLIDIPCLESAYRKLQAEVHPDKSAGLDAEAQRLAMQRSTLVNEAYQTLKSPIRRARYLLLFAGVDTQEETNTTMPVDFLMEQMERREAVAEAAKSKNISMLDKLTATMKSDTSALEGQLAVKIDAERDYAAAAQLVRKLRFMEKLAEEIDSAYDEIDSE